MKLLLFHMRYKPDATGTAPLVTQLAEDLVSYGVDVTVVASLPHYGKNVLHEDFEEHKGSFSTAVENGVKVVRTPVYIPRSKRIIQRAMNYLSYNINSVLAGLRERPADIILAINPPITTSFSAWLTSLLLGAPLVIGIQDVWPDCIIEVGAIRSKLLIGVMRGMELLQYRIARKIIVLSEGMKANLINKGVSERKIQVIPNWADPEEVKPVKNYDRFIQAHKLEDRFIVLFSGNHGYIAALDTVLEAANILKGQERILFVLAGEGNVKADLISLAAQLELTNVLFLPTQSEENWLEMLSACDLGLVTLRADLAGLNVPSKTYTLMSAARPILASVPENSEIARIIHLSRAGIISKPENARDMAARILEMSKDPHGLEEYGRNGREYLRKHINRKGQTDLYHRVLQSAIDKEK